MVCLRCGTRFMEGTCPNCQKEVGLDEYTLPKALYLWYSGKQNASFEILTNALMRQHDAAVVHLLMGHLAREIDEKAANNCDKEAYRINKDLKGKEKYILQHIAVEMLYMIINEGNDYKIKMDYEKAIDKYNEVIALKSPDPSVHAMAYSERGWAKFMSGNFDEAIEDNLKAMETEPGFVGSYFYLGMFTYRSGKHDLAKNYFQKTLEIDPSFEKHIVNFLEGEDGDDEDGE